MPSRSGQKNLHERLLTDWKAFDSAAAGAITTQAVNSQFLLAANTASG